MIDFEHYTRLEALSDSLDELASWPDHIARTDNGEGHAVFLPPLSDQVLTNEFASAVSEFTARRVRQFIARRFMKTIDVYGGHMDQAE